MDVDVLLCDHAQVAGKLFISGANIDRFVFAAEAPAPYLLTFALAGVVHVPFTSTNTPHELAFTIVTEDGHPPLLGGAPPGEPPSASPIAGAMTTARRTQRPGRIPADDLDEILSRVHRVISNLRTWLRPSPPWQQRRWQASLTRRATRARRGTRRGPPHGQASSRAAAALGRRCRRPSPRPPGCLTPPSTSGGRPDLLAMTCADAVESPPSTALLRYAVQSPLASTSSRVQGASNGSSACSALS